MALIEDKHEDNCDVVLGFWAELGLLTRGDVKVSSQTILSFNKPTLMRVLVSHFLPYLKEIDKNS